MRRTQKNTVAILSPGDFYTNSQLGLVHIGITNRDAKKRNIAVWIAKNGSIVISPVRVKVK